VIMALFLILVVLLLIGIGVFVRPQRGIQMTGAPHCSPSTPPTPEHRIRPRGVVRSSFFHPARWRKINLAPAPAGAFFMRRV
jgi:hypothetical protein